MNHVVIIRKIILGPFKSELNPMGIMNAEFTASNILLQAKAGLTLIIVSINPISYISVPINELIRRTYSKLISLLDK